MSAELLAPGLAIGAAFESAYPVAKGNYYDFEARAILLYTTVHLRLILGLHYKWTTHLTSMITTK